MTAAPATERGLLRPIGGRIGGSFELPDGSRLAYVAFGQRARPTAIVVPGLTDGLAPVFHPAGAQAVDRPPPAFRDHRVLVVSHRRPVGEQLTTAQMARDLARFIEAGTDAPVALVGHSMGGMVAQHLAIERPELVGRLVLSSTVASADPVFAERLAHWERLLEQRRWRDFSGDAIDASFVGWGRLWRRLLLRIQRMEDFDPELVERHLVLSRASRSHDAVGRLGEIAAPSIVIVGRDDELTRPVRAHEVAAAIPGARLVEVPRAGHGLPEQQGGAYVRAIRRFLDGQPVGRLPGRGAER